MNLSALKYEDLTKEYVQENFEEFKKQLLNHGSNDINDGKFHSKTAHNKFTINYFENSENNGNPCIYIKNYKNEDESFSVYQNSLESPHLSPINPYFSKKFIDINDFPNIELKNREYNGNTYKSNFFIPIYDADFKRVGSQIIYWNKASERKEISNEGQISNNFYYHGNKQSSIIVIAEGITTLLAFASISYDPSMLYVCSFGVENIENVLHVLLNNNPLISAIYYLIDNDKNQVGQNKFKEINKKYEKDNIILYPIISPYEGNDFCDDYVYAKSKIRDKTIKNIVEDSYIGGLINEIQAFNKSELFIPIFYKQQFEQVPAGKFSEKNYKKLNYDCLMYLLDIYKYKIADGTIYVFNPKNSTYGELKSEQIKGFIFNTMQISQQTHMKMKDEVERMYYTVLANTARSTKFNTAINYKNGSIDLSKSVIYAHHLNTNKYVNYNYYDDETYLNKYNNSVLKQFLTSTFPDADDFKQYKECMGFLFTTNSMSKLIYAIGSGNNGKSVNILLISNTFQCENSILCSVSLDDFMYKEINRPNALGKLISLSSEFSGKIKEQALFKAVTSREPIQFRKMYCDPFETDQYPKFLVNSNELPAAITTSSESLIKRIIPLAFRQTFTDNEDFLNSLMTHENYELYFNFILRCIKEFKNKIELSPYNEELRKAMFESMDQVQFFVELNGIEKGEVMNSASSLYKYFQEFCVKNNFPEIGDQTFSKKMLNRGFLKVNKDSRRYYMLNKKLVQNVSDVWNTKKNAEDLSF